MECNELFGYGTIKQLFIQNGIMNMKDGARSARALLPTGAQCPVSPIYFIGLKDTATGQIEGQDLAQTMMAKIAYDPAMIPGDFPEENLRVYWFDPVFSHWFKVPSMVDKEHDEIYFWTNHFASSFMVQASVVQDLSPEEYRDMGISPLKSYATQGPVNVSPMGGAMSTRAVDLVLPGKDGNDLVFARTLRFDDRAGGCF